MMHPSGSYRPGDVTFLLKSLQMVGTSIEEKERRIQSGAGHYSEMLTLEKAPTPEYTELYQSTLKRNGPRFAADVYRLACQIAADVAGDITLVSLARAGTPVGVLVTRTLNQVLNRPATHYSVSIIRDRGLDLNALRFILSRHPASSVVFVDGWTGKGVIGRELAASVQSFNDQAGTSVSPKLYVVADIAGTAGYAATGEDYLLPSAVLNSTVSGLVSRTLLNEQIGPDDFHGCVFYDHLVPHDVSTAFADTVFSLIQQQTNVTPAAPPAPAATTLEGVCRRYMATYALPSINFVKPGVGEATRVMLRRKPRLLVLRETTAPDTEHLRFLAAAREVPVLIDATLPCNALALINFAD